MYEYITIVDATRLDSIGYTMVAHTNVIFIYVHVHLKRKDPIGLMQSNCVFRDATATAQQKIGWYNCTQLPKALMYARPVLIGDTTWRVVFRVYVCCRHRVNGRNWSYTKSGCRRYSVVDAIFFRCDEAH